MQWILLGEKRCSLSYAPILLYPEETSKPLLRRKLCSRRFLLSPISQRKVEADTKATASLEPANAGVVTSSTPQLVSIWPGEILISSSNFPNGLLVVSVAMTQIHSEERGLRMLPQCNPWSKRLKLNCCSVHMVRFWMFMINSSSSWPRGEIIPYCNPTVSLMMAKLELNITHI